MQCRARAASIGRFVIVQPRPYTVFREFCFFLLLADSSVESALGNGFPCDLRGRVPNLFRNSWLQIEVAKQSVLDLNFDRRWVWSLLSTDGAMDAVQPSVFQFDPQKMCHLPHCPLSRVYWTLLVHGKEDSLNEKVIDVTCWFSLRCFFFFIARARRWCRGIARTRETGRAPSSSC